MVSTLVVSIHALVGIRMDNMMVMPMMLKETCFLALLDTGSTHNFIHPTIATAEGLSFVGCSNTSVIVANGDKVACQGRADEVTMSVNGVPFTTSMYAIPLEGFALILVRAPGGGE